MNPLMSFNSCYDDIETKWKRNEEGGENWSGIKWSHTQTIFFSIAGMSCGLLVVVESYIIRNQTDRAADLL